MVVAGEMALLQSTTLHDPTKQFLHTQMEKQK